MTQTEEVTTTQATPAEGKQVVQAAEFGETIESPTSSGENLDILLDIQMPVTVVLGKTQIPFKRLLQLAPGSVLELDKAVGAAADLYVQDIQLATGDIVVVNDSYGIRIRQVLGGDPARSMKIAAGEKKAKA